MPQIRDAGPGDAVAIAAVHIASWQAAYRGLMPDDVLAGLSGPEHERLWAGRLRELRARTAVLLATSDDAVVGFAAVGPNLIGDEGDDAGALYSLYLHPDHWRRGIGARLHAAALRRLTDLGFGSATLWILNGNERAAAFYHREGWTADGHQRFDTGPGGIQLDELRYSRLL